jgi:hypothetical protein
MTGSLIALASGLIRIRRAFLALVTAGPGVVLSVNVIAPRRGEFVLARINPSRAGDIVVKIFTASAGWCERSGSVISSRWAAPVVRELGWQK